ncbi:DUF6371 domain-containing protein [Tenacibaculum soleae]|uniref:DUF6371 domain-containing protein n=1 Tax=Tenacibaculum soleae TaxID=447689 RepID=UPI0026E154F5|nr:DUF6371 domain-containing protein [Tenacibaculum soleae]MDO6812258.1 DUF6371 domain-containing protein [Tenacibaculum soleae]
MYKYSLHKKSIKHKCPQCKKNKLVLYIDTENDNYLSSKVGRCDREINCGYHLTPKTYFKNHNISYKPLVNKNHPLEIKETDFHPLNELNDSLAYYDKNNFIQFIKSKFNLEQVSTLLNDYKIGTAASWNNGTIFWQIDSKNKIRGGKIILYSNRGKRTKYINWRHSLKIKKGEINSFNLSQCFFGEHLLSKYDKPIAIVESEKTACIMSLLFEKYLWLASGSLGGLNEKKIEVLKNRKIILYPDLGIESVNGSPYTKWKSTCDELKLKGYDIQVSNLLEEKGSRIEREKGFDIADYFLKSIQEKPKIITSKTNNMLLKMYMKNKNLKSLIEVFELTDINGVKIKIN